MPLEANELMMLSSTGPVQDQVQEVAISLNHFKLNQGGCMTDTVATHQKASESTLPYAPIFLQSITLAYHCKHLVETSTNDK